MNMFIFFNFKRKYTFNTNMYIHYFKVQRSVAGARRDHFWWRSSCLLDGLSKCVRNTCSLRRHMYYICSAIYQTLKLHPLITRHRRPRFLSYYYLWKTINN